MLHDDVVVVVVAAVVASFHYTRSAGFVRAHLIVKRSVAPRAAARILRPQTNFDDLEGLHIIYSGKKYA